MTDHQSRHVPAPDHAEQEPRSSYGHVPGEELPPAIYVSVLVSFAGLLVASWLLFARSGEIGLDLIIATVLFTAMLGLPVLLGRMVSRRTGARGRRPGMAPTHVETHTGTLSSGEAWLQILLIPLAMAFAAVAIGVVSLMVG